MSKKLALLFCLIGCPALGQTYFSNPPITLSNGSLTDGPSVMADFNQIVSDGNTTFNGFSSAISGLSGGTPSGAVVAFNLGGCPTGWIPSDGTSGTVDMRGRFAREDNGDSTGTIYADQFYTHTHNLGGSYLLPPINYSEFEGQSCSGCTNFIANAITGTNSQVGYTSTGNSGGETRPKNVALLYCQKS